MVCAGLALMGGAVVHADEWHHAVTPYLWGSGMSGKVAIGTPLGPVEADVDMSFGDILSNLDFGAMVSYQGGRGNWVVLGDFILMNLGADKDSAAGALNIRSSADMEQTMFEADVGYRISRYITAFAGARYSDIDGEIGVVTSGVGPGSSRSVGTSESWVDPVVGLLGEFPLSEHWQWDLRMDIGGFGVGSDFAWQAMGTVRWKLRPNLDVVASYRYMEVDFGQDGNSGLLVYDMVSTGPGLGVTFRF
jgi:opacity protein-like surface antigen